MTMLSITEQIERGRLELASGRHTPSKSMVAMAKRGLAAARQRTDVPEDSIAVGRKVAAGQQLSSDHVKAMANFHAAHEFDCSIDDSAKDGVQDMLWGGAPGAAWSAARSAAIDVSSLSEDAVEVGADDDLSLEIFVSGRLFGAVDLAEEDDVIWAPILRSGTHAMRPGPFGAKLREPLVIVPGRASDPAKEIGLENLLANFEAGAVQHVTIPTTHENGVLDNNGYVVGLRIANSKAFPGERELWAGHRMTEADVKGRLQRGSVANRSCGILHNYINTETGAEYDQVLEHVALTNKPWIRGMAAYGDLSDADLSERQVVPMLLSEAPSTNLADSVSDGSWDGSASRFTDQQYQRSCLVDRGGTAPPKSRCSLPVREPDGTLNRAAVHSAAGRIAALGDVSTDQKRAAAKKLISLYRGPLKEQPPINLIRLASVSTKMSEPERQKELLADVQWGDSPSYNDIRSGILGQLDNFRSDEPGGPYYSVLDVSPDNKALIDCEHGYGLGTDSWVVPFTADSSGVKLGDFSQWTPVTRSWVTDEDANQDKQETAATVGPGGMPHPTPFDALAERSSSRLQLPQERHSQQGGAMPIPTQDVLDRLELSDEAKAVLQQIASENSTLKTQLADTKRGERKAVVTARVKELQDKGFPPGFCAEYERIALGDDGNVAIVLNLSENGVESKTDQTATQVVDRLINALPLDESGKLALKGQANLAESPIGARPPVDTADASRTRTADGEEPAPAKDGKTLLAQWGDGVDEGTARMLAEFEGKLAPATPTATQ